MRFHNLGTVIAFEVRRTLLKPSFWLTSLSIPALMALVFGLMWFSQSSVDASQREQASERLAFTYTDASGIVTPAVAERLGGTVAPDGPAAAQAVREGRSDLHIDVPADPSADPVHIVGADRGLTGSGRWHEIARNLVEQSASERIGDPRLVAAATDVTTDEELWKDGERSGGFGAAAAPAVFLALLYLSVFMLGSQMLTITVEEKENRVTEMILTTIESSTLIVGKVVAVLLVGLVQGLVFLTPLVLAGFVLGLLGGPAVDETASTGLQLGGEALVVQPAPMLIGAGLFASGFLVFTGLLVTIGAIMPTAKEASSAFGVVILAMFIPMYAMAAVINAPDGTLSTILTWFPLTAPVTALTRNALGMLPVPIGLGVIAVLVATGILLLWWGVRLFKAGSISYDQRLKLIGLRGSGGRDQKSYG